MKYFFLLLILARAAAGAAPAHWSAVTELRDVHEFYQSNEVLSKPAGAWQLLFSVMYLGRSALLLKDCVFYRIPSESENGVLKIRTLGSRQDCADYILDTGDQHWAGIKALQFAINDSDFSLQITHPRYRIERWRVLLPPPKRYMKDKLPRSSAQFRARALFFLSEKEGGEISSTLKNGELCHDVNDDCEVRSKNLCEICPGPWYEVPNGCTQGPKYCGVVSCGERNQPACRRGMRHQRKLQKFDCRIDPSYAYCSKGLKVSCEGSQAHCR